MRCGLAAMAVVTLALACEPPARPTPPAPTPDAGCVGGGDGYADPPASGHVFVVDQIQLTNPGDGIDVTGDGVPDTAMNRAFFFLQFVLNEALRHTVENGRLIYVFELAGLCAPYSGDDPDVTVKVYSCRDANDDSSDNFCRDPGCGTMRVHEQEFNTDGQTVNHSQPLPIVDQLLVAVLPGSIDINLDTTANLGLLRPAMQLTVPTALDEISAGWLCGVVRAGDLDQVVPPHASDPECRTLCWPDDAPEGLSLAGYMAMNGYQPDIDMDGDGLERFELDADKHVVRCYDGPRQLPLPHRWPAPCLQDPRMADGYSLCFKMHALPGVLLLE
jgi:hypothetical protein